MTDIEIASKCKKEKIENIAKKLNLKDDDIIKYGEYKAKIKYENIKEKNKGKLILVTATNPTPFGEGKTTVTIGLVDALNKLGEMAIAALREPSLGPVFGLKGGATGGGLSQVVPMEEINLHFTGDLHAITSANNLISAAIDNHIYSGNTLDIDKDKILFKRCLDVNDRSLRDILINGENSYKTSFNITAASEVMNVFCLSKNLSDLKENLGNIMIAKTKTDKPLYVKDLHIEGALTVLLKEAFNPNLVQTLENNPVIIHGGPFANIAHGCNSIVATNLALKLSNYVVTEAGFGSDLGAEKFFDIKCRANNLKPDATVITTTIRALKYNGGKVKEEVTKEDIESLTKGLENLEVHIGNMKKYTSHVIVALNKFESDTEKEIEKVKEFCEKKNVKFAVSTAYKDGSKGAESLAKIVLDETKKENDFKYLYENNLTVKEKIEKICKEIYRADDVYYEENAEKEIKFIEKNKMEHLPVCIAKTQYSLSDDPKKLGAPKHFKVTVREVEVHTGSKFITVLLGKILTMPGLPKRPNYEQIKLDEKNNITGLF